MEASRAEEGWSETMIPGTLSTRAGRGFVLVFTALAAVEVLGSVADVGSSIPFKFGILQVLLCCLCAPAAAQQTLPWHPWLPLGSQLADLTGLSQPEPFCVTLW